MYVLILYYILNGQLVVSRTENLSRWDCRTLGDTKIAMVGGFDSAKYTCKKVANE